MRCEGVSRFEKCPWVDRRLRYRPTVLRPRLAFWSAAITALERLPHGALSRFAGRLADVPIPRPARRPVLTAFAKAV
ncbi:MAG TPA: hypothetical protein VJ788_09875, partial [Gemmatimonadota bacterium]|nr:hypothetical protein [Gemmatimonadota bacterium]